MDSILNELARHNYEVIFSVCTQVVKTILESSNMREFVLSEKSDDEKEAFASHLVETTLKNGGVKLPQRQRIVKQLNSENRCIQVLKTGRRCSLARKKGSSSQHCSRHSTKGMVKPPEMKKKKVKFLKYGESELYVDIDT